jgi:hypothetical protein
MGQLARYRKREGKIYFSTTPVVAFDTFEDLDKIMCGITSVVH